MPPQSAYASLIDVEHLQRYVLETDKLREMLGASRLIDGLSRMACTATGCALPSPRHPIEPLANQFPDVHLLWPVSGAVMLWSLEQSRLADLTWILHQHLETKGIQHVVGFVGPVDAGAFTETGGGNRLREEVIVPLSHAVRAEKEVHRGTDASPGSALFAPCRIHGHEPANKYRTFGPAQQEPRRALLGMRADHKLELWERSKRWERKRLAHLLAESLLERHIENGGVVAIGTTLKTVSGWIENAIQFDDLIAPERPLEDPTKLDPTRQRQDSFLALLKADGDGLGALIQNVDWNSRQWLGAGSSMLPWKRAKKFAQTLDRITRDAVDEATCQVTWSRLQALDDLRERKDLEALHGALENGAYRADAPVVRIPVLPLLFGGDDLWLLARREIAFEFSIAFAKAFELKVADGICHEALEVVRKDSQGRVSPHLSMSLGVVFAKSGFPFDPMFELAGSLLKSAKRLRKGEADPEVQSLLASLGGQAENEAIPTAAGIQPATLSKGCADWHWLASSARETLGEARTSGYRYRDGTRLMSLTSRPWTLEATDSLLKVVKVLNTLPTRKLEQLDGILRRGLELSELGWKLWLEGLDAEARKCVINLLSGAKGDVQLPEELRPDNPEESPWRQMCQPEGELFVTPLLDLTELRGVLVSQTSQGEYHDA